MQRNRNHDHRLSRWFDSVSYTHLNAIRKNSIGRHRKTINTPESTRRTPAICLNLPHMRIPLLPLSYARRAAKYLYPPMPSSRTISPTSTELPMP